MLLDKTQLFQDGVAIATASAEVDTSSANKGEPLKIFASGSGVAATGDITITLSSAATSGGSFTTDATHLATAAELNDGVNFTVPSHAGRYLRVAFTGTSISGNVTAGIVLGTQTNL